MKRSEYEALLEKCQGNMAIFDSIVKANSVLNEKGFITPVCKISGGADSDCILALTKALRDDVEYVWFDTGLEYQATKDHLAELEEKYGVTIQKVKPKKPVPVACKEYGVPFLSKRISDMCYRLQYNGFKWEDEPFDVLIKRYPTCYTALSWWCNTNQKGGPFNIERYPFLKEFMVENPPDFKISPKCCTYSKRRVSAEYDKIKHADLYIMGARKAEGGVRQTTYKTCFTAGTISEYRPIFWYTRGDREEFEKIFGVTHSRCYTEYGLARTGCCGCPCAGQRLEAELSIMQEHEPKLYKAAWAVFGKSYEYTRKYKAYREERKNGKRNEEVPGGPE